MGLKPAAWVAKTTARTPVRIALPAMMLLNLRWQAMMAMHWTGSNVSCRFKKASEVPQIIAACLDYMRSSAKTQRIDASSRCDREAEKLTFGRLRHFLGNLCQYFSVRLLF
eukprot:scaffold37_cov329-Pinguiococcus_pyrenoidosus.AAC.2